MFGRIVSALIWRAATLSAMVLAANAITGSGALTPASLGAAVGQMQTALDDVNRALAMARRL